MPRLTSISTPAPSSTAEAKGTSGARQDVDGCRVDACTPASAGGRWWTLDTKAADMTRNESFKRRVRQRMAKTGEKYGAARRVLIEQAAGRQPSGWAAQPQHTDEVITANTGRSWDEWRTLIEGWPGHSAGHTGVASWLVDEHGVDDWWAQAVTVGWERISGRRLPHQMADGTFTANASATIATDAEALRELLLDDAGRRDLFPGEDVELRSRPTSKNVRLALRGGTAEIAITPRDDGRVKLAVAHAKLASPQDVEYWKAFWAGWLKALDEASAPG